LPYHDPTIQIDEYKLFETKLHKREVQEGDGSNLAKTRQDKIGRIKRGRGKVGVKKYQVIN
jgi:hypothetical protein